MKKRAPARRPVPEKSPTRVPPRKRLPAIAPVPAPAKADWAGEYDFIVVGFGIAGACAAIEVHDRGARVLVVDRFQGGGATKMSGGVIYAGGGTRQQVDAGFHDHPEKMLRYMQRELSSNPAPKGQPQADRAVLKDFCDKSRANLEWLESLGLAIPSKFFPGKTNQPPGGHGLYFSGNEKQYAGSDDPMPRGHVPLGTGMSGGPLFRVLREAVQKRRIPVLPWNSAQRILLDEKGAVHGVELRDSRLILLRPALLLLKNLGFVSARSRRLLGFIETRLGRRRRYRAARGVLLSCGGHVYHKALFEEHAPAYKGTLPLGTPGDDGSGVRLGISAGGAHAAMDVCAASRFIYPPAALVGGILVNRDGVRFTDESLYGASLSRAISRQEGRAAWLIIDRRIHREAAAQVRSGESLRGIPLGSILRGEQNAILYRRLTTFVNLHVNRRKARTLEALAAKCGIPPGALKRTVEEYRQAFLWRQDKAFGKPREHLAKLSEAPWYAIDCRIDNLLFPIPCLTMGGLRVEGLSSRVLKKDGTAVPGLYAAGRSAAGICSRSYVSGFSLADGIYGGRNAAAHACGKKAGRNA